jgi:hypothetical protein
LIAEKAKGHHADFVDIFGGVHCRNRQRDGKGKRDERCANPPDPGLQGHGVGHHGEPQFRDRCHSMASQNEDSGTAPQITP